MKSTSITYRIIAISMALLMFITSVEYTIDMHYCQGQLKTIGVLGKAKSCHEIGAGMKNCPHHKKMKESKELAGNTSSKKDCCSNKTVHFDSDLDQQFQSDNAVLVSNQVQHFLLAFVETFLTASVTEIAHPTYAQYTPPLISRDIYVLLETYRL